MHEEEVNIAGCILLARVRGPGDRVFRTVVDEESLVAGRHQVAGLLVGAIADLCCGIPSAKVRVASRLASHVSPLSEQRQFLLFYFRRVVRTLGIAACPLNLLRTLLSIPLGFLHDGSTPVHICQNLSSRLPRCINLTFEAVRLVAVEALGVCSFRQLRILFRRRRSSVRFLTIGTCFLAATI